MYSVRFQIIKCQNSFLVMKGVNIVIRILQMTNISLLLGGNYSKYLLKNHVKVGQNNHQLLILHLTELSKPQSEFLEDSS